MQQTNPQFVCINAPGTEFHNRIAVVQEPGQPTIVQENGERGYIAFDETQLRVLCGSRMYGHNTTYWVPCIRPAHHPNACNRAFLSPDDITPTQACGHAGAGVCSHGFLFEESPIDTQGAP